MRLLILQQYFYPDLSATAQYVTDLAGDLAERGHEVAVLASRAVLHGGPMVAPAFEWVRGVATYRTPGTNFGKASTLSRIADYSSYLMAASAYAFWLPRPDVVLAFTTPPLLPVLGAVLRRLRGSRLVCVLEDIYPELAVRMGHLRAGGVLTHSVRAAIHWAQRCADRVVVIGRCMREVVRRNGVDPRRIVFIPNWADEAEVALPEGEPNPMIEAHGLAGRFVLLYSGNMGWGHDFETFLGAAARLRADPDVLFVFIGDGHRKAEVAKAIEQQGLPNVRLLPYQPRSRLRYSLNLGAATLISQRQEVDGLLVPSKLYPALAIGKPILFVGSSSCEVGSTVRETECGYVVPPGDVDGLVARIRELRENPERAREMGARGRNAFRQRYQRHLAIDAYERMLREVATRATMNVARGRSDQHAEEWAEAS